MTHSDEERRLRDSLASEAGEYVTVRRDDLAWALRSEPIPRPGEGTDWRAVAGDLGERLHNMLGAGGTELYDAAVARYTKGG